ncbi:fibronectin type III domain-containing protein [Lactococcus petauri]|uniref:fibronectin type III domain-containing protein n=1 Tax=Lactococcus petauri TaxID=1940789 RepID=UPI003851ACBC
MLIQKKLLINPNAPQNVSGVINEDGSVTVNWGVVNNEAKAFVIHYGNANQSDPHEAIYMGYTESKSWTLSSADAPALQVGDKLYLYVQSFNEVGTGANDIEKAQYLNTNVLGSEWSKEVVLTKAAVTRSIPNETSTVADIKAYLDSQSIAYPSTAKKDELLTLIGGIE